MSSFKIQVQRKQVETPERSLEDVLLDLANAVAEPKPCAKSQPWLARRLAEQGSAAAGAVRARARGHASFRPERAPGSQRAQVCRTAGAKLLALLLDHNAAASEYVRCQAASALLDLSIEDEGREQLAASGGLVHLVEVAANYVGQAAEGTRLGTREYDANRLVEAALGALRNAAGFKGAAAAAVAAGVVQPLVEAMAHGAPAARALAAGAALGLAQHGHLLGLLRDHGVVGALVAFLGDSGLDPLFRLLGARGLCEMARDEEVCKDLPYMIGPVPATVVSSPGTRLSKTKAAFFAEEPGRRRGRAKEDKEKVHQIIIKTLQMIHHPEDFDPTTDYEHRPPPTGPPRELIPARTSEALLLLLLKLFRLEQHRRHKWARETVPALLQQVEVGTEKARSAALLILCLLQLDQSGDQIATALCGPIVHLLTTAAWEVRISCAKAILNLYHRPGAKAALASAGAPAALVAGCLAAAAAGAGAGAGGGGGGGGGGAGAARAPELLEHPLAALLHLAVLPQVPTQILDAGGLELLAEILSNSMGEGGAKKIIRILCLGILKACYIYHSRCNFFIDECPQWIIHDIKHCPEELQDFIGEVIALRKSIDYFEIPEDRAAWFEPNQLETIKANFKELDEDASGAIDAEELESLLRKLGEKPTRRRVLKIIEEVDEDESGEVEFNEFLLVMKMMGEGKATALGNLVQRAFLEDLFETAKEAAEKIWTYFHKEEHILAQMDAEDAARREYLRELHHFGDEYWEAEAARRHAAAESAWAESLTRARRRSLELQRLR